MQNSVTYLLPSQSIDFHSDSRTSRTFDSRFHQRWNHFGTISSLTLEFPRMYHSSISGVASTSCSASSDVVTSMVAAMAIIVRMSTLIVVIEIASAILAGLILQHQYRCLRPKRPRCQLVLLRFSPLCFVTTSSLVLPSFQTWAFVVLVLRE
jgi:hypothetical protein